MGLRDLVSQSGGVGLGHPEVRASRSAPRVTGFIFLEFLEAPLVISLPFLEILVPFVDPACDGRHKRFRVGIRLLVPPLDLLLELVDFRLQEYRPFLVLVGLFGRVFGVPHVFYELLVRLPVEARLVLLLLFHLLESFFSLLGAAFSLGLART